MYLSRGAAAYASLSFTCHVPVVAVAVMEALMTAAMDGTDLRIVIPNGYASHFIWRDASHAHSPHTPDGCLCYTVQDAPVQFTKGLSRLLNGITHRLY